MAYLPGIGEANQVEMSQEVKKGRRRIPYRRGKAILNAWLAKRYECVYRETQAGGAIDVYHAAPTMREMAWANLTATSQFVRVTRETEVVYVVQPESLQRVKIGSAKNVGKRIVDLQIGCPLRLRLVAQMVCIKSMEFMIHQAFEAERLHGEWFELSPRLIDFIGHMRTGNKQAIYEELMLAIAANAEKWKGG